MTAPTRPPVDYLRDVRPIFAQHCYRCHGPDAAERKAGLRLDVRDDALADRDAGAALVAGDAARSAVIQRVTSTDPDEIMPPPDAGAPLQPHDIELLRRWIDGGAPWQEHWAFVPPARPALPPVADSSWPRNEIDYFVLARLEQQGLQPSPEAAREIWLRRVTFDLIGLPPTPAEIDEFVRDHGPDAHARVVDRLLADERYGERQAVEWLDLARYADSNGYQRDAARQAFKWRDWVIAACNDNMPFDRFTIEQLAGDLLPEPTLQQRIATGFNRNHPINTEAGEELDEYRSAYVIDRVHTTATTWLGLSLACAQCHDHKYDPISQREFYSFYAFFDSIKEKDNGGFGRNPKPSIPAPDPENEARLVDLERRITMLKARLDRDDPLTDALQAEWEQDVVARLGAPLHWTTLVATERLARNGSRLQQLDDGSVLATGPTPARDSYELVFTPGKRTIHALRLEVLPDPSLPHGASGRADDGRFILSRLDARLFSIADGTEPPPIVWALAQADINQQHDEDGHYLTAIEPGPIAAAVGLPGREARGFARGWSIADDERKEPREAVLIPLEPLVCNENSVLRLQLVHDGAGKFRSQIGRFRVSISEEPRIRSLLLPLQPSTWQALGPFPATDVAAAFATSFAPEKDFARAAWTRKYDQPRIEPEDKSAKQPSKPGGEAPQQRPASAAAQPPKQTAAAAVEPAPGASGNAAATGAGDGASDASAAGGTSDESDAADESADQPPPEKIRLGWQEHREWVDGGAASLPVEGAAVAWYIARRITTEKARSIELELSGGAAARIWLNGKIVGAFEPKADPGPRPGKAGPDTTKGEATQADDGDEDDDEDEEAPQAAFFTPGAGPGRESEPHRLVIGMRQGENLLVLKLVGAGRSPAKPGTQGDGPMVDAAALAAMGIDIDDLPPSAAKRMRSPHDLRFTIALRAGGEDLLDYEVMQALRTRPDSPSLARQPVEASARRNAAWLDVDSLAKPPTVRERREAAIRRFYRTRIDVGGKALFDELQRLEVERARFAAKLPSALVMEELKRSRETHVFVRGDYRQKGERVAAGTPAVLPPMPPDLPRNRLGLARWLVAPEHPLTARVVVNRAWQQFFGLGIVRTADDFGVRGAEPSHPELLDWLAVNFVATGWDVKRLHRAIALSATYRQSGRATQALLERDPENVLLARGPHQRLTAEMVRDQALYASGLLVQKIGGPSIKPYQPPGLWAAMLGSEDWETDKGSKAHRRGLYVHWKRGVPYPSFMAFDAAKRETCTASRPRTTTPLQALVTLNDPVYFEAGRALGLRLRAADLPDDAARIALGFRLVASRAPEAPETTVLLALLGDLRAHYAADPKAARRAIAVSAGKSAKRPQSQAVAAPAPAAAIGAAARRFEAAADPVEAAAWAQLGATLLNLEAAIRRG